jgi:murein DD-endopeptidase MepM/ murein hydrolase activator NlpD
MLKKPKLFFVLPDTLGIREIKGVRRKVVALIFGSVAVALVLILGVNRALNGIIGIGDDKIESLSNENRVLRHELRTMSGKLSTLQSALERLAQRDRELRLLVDLPKIDEDVRKVGIGGTTQSYDFGLSSSEANDLLRSASMLMDRLERQIKLQQESFEEVYRKYEFNKVFFSHIPALKPMEGFYVPNSFGNRFHPVLQVRKFHEGLDIINDVGTPVRATGDGLVTFSGLNAGYGIAIEIDHGYGYQTLYAHLSKSFVRQGQRVKRGDVIGKSGHTGLVSGPHLHYEVRLNGEKKNPLLYFFDETTGSSEVAQAGDG